MPANYRRELVHQGADAGKPELAHLRHFRPVAGTFQIDITSPLFTLRREQTGRETFTAVTDCH